MHKALTITVQMGQQTKQGGKETGTEQGDTVRFICESQDSGCLPTFPVLFNYVKKSM